MGAAAETRETLAMLVMGPRRTAVEQTLAAARSTLGAGEFDRAWSAGQAMSLSEAMDFALEPAGKRAVQPHRLQTSAAPTRSSSGLSRREQEIAALVAQGRTNRAIGATLGITEKTVGAHVQNIMNKLGFHSRSQIAAWTATRASDRTH
jgi:non-specific serine/threonine protein kinase